MKQIPLGNSGKFALVDDADYANLSEYNWRCTGNGYAQRTGPRPRRESVLMHREIVDAPAGTEVDHVNHNRLDNRRCNLRLCTAAENRRNATKSKNNTSGYRGVSYHIRTGRWVAQIKVSYRNNHIGSYASAKEAAQAYDAKARELFGDFANLNFAGKRAEALQLMAGLAQKVGNR